MKECANYAGDPTRIPICELDIANTSRYEIPAAKAAVNSRGPPLPGALGRGPP